MKKAFTLLELVIVIVIIGIVSSLAIPKFERNDLILAADQVASHIKYTQHLAIIDDKFDAEDNNWFKSRWQIFFTQTQSTGKQWSYNIFSDTAGEHSGFPNPSELAKNPLNPAKLMSAGYSGAFASNDPRASEELNIGKKYNISNVSLVGQCTGGRIYFDELGRPYNGNLSKNTRPTEGLLLDPCGVKLSQSDNQCIFVVVRPITGLASVCVPKNERECTSDTIPDHCFEKGEREK